MVTMVRTVVPRVPVDDTGDGPARSDAASDPTLGTPTRLFTAVVATLVVGVGLPVAVAVAGWVPASTANRWTALAGCLLSLVAGGAALSCSAQGARATVPDQHLAAAMALIGLGAVVLGVGTLAPALIGDGPVGPLADGRLQPLQVVAMVLLTAGTLTVPTPGHRGVGRVIDATLIVLAGLTLIWVAPLRGQVDPSGGLVQVLRDDPAMVSAVALMLIAATLLVRIDPDEQRAMRPLVIGLLLYPAAFFTAEVASSGSGNAVGEAFVEMYWVTAPVLLLGASRRTAHRLRSGPPPSRPDRPADAPTPTARIQSALPGTAVVVILIGVASHQWFMGRISPVTMAIGIVTVLLAVGRQAILQRDQHQLFEDLRHNASELAHQARHDRLTGLGNRTALAEQLAELLRRPTPAGVSVFFIDLDNFKAINDSLGHDTGDELLMELSVRLTDVIGPSVYRIGGDEFIAVRSDLDGERAEAMAGAVVAALEPPLVVQGRPIVAAASIGLARSRPRRDPGRGSRDTADALLRRADLALYRAKELGRGRWAAYDVSLQDRADRRLELQQGLRRAVDEGTLEVVYEPVVSLPDRDVVGAAALLRWTTPHRGILDHDEVLAVAEEAGLRPQLLDVLLDEVGTRLAEAAHGTDHPVWISVGIGADDVGRTDLPGRLSAMLAASRMPPGMLQVEVPEATVADDRTADLLERLVRMGVGLIVTGFGNGPSSLRHLAHYPAPAIEVDRSFVNGIGQRREDRLIVEAVGRLAIELGLDLVGAGVSSQVQAAHLESLGAARAAGPLFGRPVPWDEFARRHLLGTVPR